MGYNDRKNKHIVQVKSAHDIIDVNVSDEYNFAFNWVQDTEMREIYTSQLWHIWKGIAAIMYNCLDAYNLNDDPKIYKKLFDPAIEDMKEILIDHDFKVEDENTFSSSTIEEMKKNFFSGNWKYMGDKD